MSLLALPYIVLAADDRVVGLVLDRIAIDGSITKAVGGARQSAVPR